MGHEPTYRIINIDEVLTLTWTTNAGIIIHFRFTTTYHGDVAYQM